MATFDTYIPFNMLTGFNFSKLLFASDYAGNSGWFTAGYSNGTNDTLWGRGFSYDYDGVPTGSGTVTGYTLFGNWSSEVLVQVYGFSVPASWVLSASLTGSRADDFAIARIALAGADTVLGSDYADVLDGFAGNDTIRAWSGNDTVLGEAGNDRLDGMFGNDVIVGGAGNDTLTGGAGSDYFVFNAALSATANVDRITDFNVAQDTIRVDNAVMPGLGARVGTLAAGQFWKSATGQAHDANDRIIYETDTGWLNYDSNGSAAGGLVHFAKLAPNLALTNADFTVI
jgi:Ca2+-binding RTX toxin-like protein